MKRDSFNLEHIVSLVRLKLSSSQKRGLQEDLTDVLKFVAVLEKIKVPPKSAYGRLLPLESITKVDISADIWQPDIAANLRGQAPQTKNNYLVVEPVINK